MFVSEVNDATIQAVRDARSLGAQQPRAVFFALGPENTDAVKRDWAKGRLPVPLEVVEAPFRSLEEPVLAAVRSVSGRPETVAWVVIPEIDAGSWWQDLLHNGQALYLKWLLLSEPRVVLSTVT